MFKDIPTFLELYYKDASLTMHVDLGECRKSDE